MGNERERQAAQPWQASGFSESLLTQVATVERAKGGDFQTIRKVLIKAENSSWSCGMLQLSLLVAAVMSAGAVENKYGIELACEAPMVALRTERLLLMTHPSQRAADTDQSCDFALPDALLLAGKSMFALNFDRVRISQANSSAASSF